MVIQRPTRELIAKAVNGLDLYAILRQTLGRDAAFKAWTEDLDLTDYEVTQLGHFRVRLLLDIYKGLLTYDDIDWSGSDEDRRASSTGTEWVDSLSSWLSVGA